MLDLDFEGNCVRKGGFGRILKDLVDKGMVQRIVNKYLK